MLELRYFDANSVKAADMMCLAQASLFSSIIALPSTGIALHKHCLFSGRSKIVFRKTIFGKPFLEKRFGKSMYKTMHEMHVEKVQSNKIKQKHLH